MINANVIFHCDSNSKTFVSKRQSGRRSTSLLISGDATLDVHAPRRGDETIKAEKNKAIMAAIPNKVQTLIQNTMWYTCLLSLYSLRVLRLFSSAVEKYPIAVMALRRLLVQTEC